MKTSFIIKNLDPVKAHGCDNISIKVIKICSESLTVPLKIIIEQSLKQDRFLEIWKKGNVVPIHKQEDKNIEKIFRPISLLPIFSIAQVLSVSHEIQTGFDNNPTVDVRGVYLDM